MVRHAAPKRFMADTPISTIYLLKRAELSVRGCVEVALGAVDLTPSQYFILFLVKCGEATSSAELARSMGALPQSMSELIAPLEKTDAIVRRPDSDGGPSGAMNIGYKGPSTAMSSL